jgi:nucleoside-diphosphate-sugar epimerase
VAQETVLIIGCGYRGKKLAGRLIEKGFAVRALTRSAANAETLKTLGIDARVGDITNAATLNGIGSGVQYVFHLMGSMQGGEELLQKLHVDGTRNVLDALQACDLKRFVYESSTAVYGQMDGEWLNEDAPRNPTSTMGKLRVQAEDLVMNAVNQYLFPAIILRPSSIYRPEGVINKKIKDGTYVLASDPDKLMNHIYVDDFIDILIAAMTKGLVGHAYNVSDDGPKRFQDYVNTIATLMSAPAPKVEWETRADGCADLIRQSNKKVGNAKLKKEFGIALKFPTYREGLAESARKGWKE